MRTAKLTAAGMTDAQARTRARERFGDITTIRDECVRSERRLIQRERRMTLSEEIASDVRMAVRSARRTRGFTATALLTIALGVGATTAVFSIVRAVIIRPLPFRILIASFASSARSTTSTRRCRHRTSATSRHSRAASPRWAPTSGTSRQSPALAIHFA
jgi:hypothetical protein